MALINCKECGKEISDTSKVCIHCGVKTEKAKRNNKNLIKYASIVLVVILLFGIGFAVYSNNSKIRICNKSINILEKYKRDEIDTLKLISELEILSDEARSLSDKENEILKQLDLSSLSIRLYLISSEISTTYYAWSKHKDTSDTKIDEYIKEIKELKY